jgi:hypothetical protein
MSDEERSDETWTLREFMDSLPQGHHERAGLARAIELLNLGAESEVRSLRGVVQAAADLADYWLGSPLSITEGQAGAQVHRALAVAAERSPDAPQPTKPKEQQR